MSRVSPNLLTGGSIVILAAVTFILKERSHNWGLKFDHVYSGLIQLQHLGSAQLSSSVVVCR